MKIKIQPYIKMIKQKNLFLFKILFLLIVHIPQNSIIIVKIRQIILFQG